MNLKSLTLAAGAATFLAASASAQTAAYWRFEDGPDRIDVPHFASDGIFTQDILDVSGNGNHLSTWRTGGCCGYQHRANVESAVIPGTGEDNLYSVKNTGCCPGMFTNSLVSLPTGIDIETMTPRAWTVEASFKVEASNGYRTIVGRDARDIASGDGALAALYLQVRPNQEMVCLFVDVSGNVHAAISAPGLVTGFDYPTNPDGEGVPWHHVAAVSDGATLSLYYDNALVASADLSQSADPSLAYGITNGGDWHAGGWSVGRGLHNGNHVDRGYGYIDEVRISVGARETTDLLFPFTVCNADFNGDQFVDFFDYSDYVTCFETGACPPGKTADFNGDAFVDFFDYADFVDAFEIGC